jgi:hypothetical protein
VKSRFCEQDANSGQGTKLEIACACAGNSDANSSQLGSTEMKKILMVLSASVVSTVLISPAHACNWRQLMEGMAWCVADTGRDGYDDVLLGAAKKDAAKLDDGFESCQSGKKHEIKNYFECTPGQRIDAARATLGMSFFRFGNRS